MRYLSPEENRAIENAIIYMNDNMCASGTSKKPVIFHSVKVGFMAYQFGLSLNSVISGFLHDLIEDSDVTVTDIEEKFGKDIAETVLKLTHINDAEMKDFHRTDYYTKWQNYYESIVNDREVFFLKLIDTYENFVYVPISEGADRRNAIDKRMKNLFSLAEDSYGNDEIFQKIKKYYS